MIKQNYKLKKILSDEIVFLDQENRKISVSFEHGNIQSLEVLNARFKEFPNIDFELAKKLQKIFIKKECNFKGE